MEVNVTQGNAVTESKKRGDKALIKQLWLAFSLALLLGCLAAFNFLTG